MLPLTIYGLGVNSRQLEFPFEIDSGFSYLVQIPEGVNAYHGSSLAHAPQELLDLVFSLNRFEDIHDASHISLLNDLVIIHVPSDFSNKQPIILNSNITGKAHVQHLLVVCEPYSKAIIIDHQTSAQNSEFLSHYTEVILKDNANLDMISFQHLGKSLVLHSKTASLIGESAALNWTDFALGASFVRQRRNCTLEGDTSTASYHTCTLGSDDQLFDLKTSIIHKGQNSQSTLLSRNALNGSSKTIHRAGITIGTGIKGCTAKQNESTLLLSKQSRFNTVPMLEVGTDEVVCSHGSSITTIDEDELFYFMSRGISSDDARRMIINGFFGPLLEKIDDATAETFSSIIENTLLLGGKTA